MKQIIFTAAVLRRLAENSKATGTALTRGTREPDHVPVLKVFNPYGAATWLLTEIDEDGRCFGLCDLGMGCGELGYVLRSELEETRVKIGGYAMPLERDEHFSPVHTLSTYAAAAREGIVEDKAALDQAAGSNRAKEPNS